MITFPRKRHCHRCPLCERSVACYKSRCPYPARITVEECQWHRGAHVGASWNWKRPTFGKAQASELERYAEAMRAKGGV
jgi:hypothetical protein